MSDLHKDDETTQTKTNNTTSTSTSHSHSPDSTSPDPSPLDNSSTPIATRWIRAEDAERRRSRSRDEGRKSPDFGEGRRGSVAEPRRSSVVSGNGKGLVVDKEKEQRGKVAKLLDHKWGPGFLK